MERVDSSNGKIQHQAEKERAINNCDYPSNKMMNKNHSYSCSQKACRQLFNEFSYRINISRNKNNIFQNHNPILG